MFLTDVVPPAALAAYPAIQLEVDSTSAYVQGQLTTLDVPPMIRNGRTMVPFRFVGEALGATVGWQAAARKVIYVRGQTAVELWIGQQEALVNGIPYQLDVPPAIVKDRTVVPIRFISEALGAKVHWDPATRQVTVAAPADPAGDGSSGGTGGTGGSGGTGGAGDGTGDGEPGGGGIQIGDPGSGGTGGGQDGTGSPGGGLTGTRIYFTSERDGNEELYAVLPDGSGLTRLTDHGAADTTPAPSPDGTKLAFQSNRDGDQELYVMNFDGTGLVQLTRNTAQDRDPSWSPGGEIIFVSDVFRRGSFRMYTGSADGSMISQFSDISQQLAVETLVNPYATYLYEPAQPKWSPLGNSVAYITYDNRGGLDADGRPVDAVLNIYLAGADGSNPRPPLTPQWDRVDVAWSPDGSRLAFSAWHQGNYEIFVVNMGGTGLLRLTYDSGTDRYPAWSPDGSRLAFASNRSGNFEIYTMKTDGTGLTRLTNDPAADTRPAWGQLPSP
ncbi:MAG: PD40 domain-containing protein [Firmicutes bacterium]|nr:PD40 domain-containing protein [Bacillota bacterium]